MVSTEINSTHYDRFFTVDISDPGIYSFNMTARCEDGFFDILGIYLYSSGKRYVPGIDEYSHEREQLWSYYWSWVSTGMVLQRYEEFTFVTSGIMIIEFYSYTLSSDEWFSVNFTVSQEYSLTSAIPLSVGENTFKWTQEQVWGGYVFKPSQRGLYNFTVTEFLPYNTTPGWTPGTVQVFEPLQFFDGVHGVNCLYHQVNFQNFVGVGEGNSTYTRSWFLSCLPDNYYFTVKSKDFLYLNGTYVNLSIYVEPVPTLTLSSGQSLRLNFSSTDPDVFIALELTPWMQHNLYYDSPSGYNWSIYADDIVSDMGTPFIYSYYEYGGIPQTYELRLLNLTSLPQDTAFLGYYVPLQDLTGEHFAIGYAVVATTVEYIDGSPTGCEPYGGLYSLYNISYLYVYGVPNAISTPEFNVTLHLETVAPPETLTTTGDTLPINHTSGPVARFYQFPIQSGYIYELTATPSIYTSNGYVSISIMPGLGYENWFTNPYYYGTPILTETYPSSPWPGGAEAVNETAGIRFMSMADDILYVVVLGASYMGLPSDTEEILVNLTVIAPTPYTLGSDVIVTADSFVGYSLSVVAGYSYMLTLDLYHPGVIGTALMFDALGNTPFNVSESHIGATVYCYGLMNFTGSFFAKETANITLALIPGSTMHFRIDVLDRIAPTVSIDTPTNGAIVSGLVVINFTITDDFGISSATLTIDGDAHTVTGTTSYTWDTSTTQPGLHIITLTAKDTSGNTASQTIAVLLLPEPGSYQSGLTLGLIFTAVGTIAALVIGILVGRLTKRS